MSVAPEKIFQDQEIKPSSNWLYFAGLAVLLILSEFIYLALLRLDAINGWRPVLIFWLEMAMLFVFYGLAAVLVNRYAGNGKNTVRFIFLGAVLFRLTLLPAGIPYEMSATEKLEALRADLSGREVAYERYQLFDNDDWRYIWDGHVFAHGINPYLYAPSDTHLDTLAGDISEPEESSDDEFLSEVGKPDKASSIQVSKDITDEREIWGDIRDNVNYPEVTTIYPPLAQMIFRLSHAIAPGSLLMMKFLLVLCELIGIVFLFLTLRQLELPVTSVILYAWNPLMIKVFAGSGHADAVLVAAICATAYFIVRGWRSLGAVAFGLAILAKLSPVILVPFVARRIGWLRTVLIGAVVFIGYLPFLGAGKNLFSGFLKFAGEWQFNPGAFALVRWLCEFIAADPANLARQICAVLILAITAMLVWRDDLSGKAFVGSAAIILGAAIILSPTVMPWYLSWVLPFAVMARQFIWIYFSAVVLMAFHIMIDLNEYAIVLWLEHGLFFALVLRQLWVYRGTIDLSLWPGLIPASAGKHINIDQ